MIKLPSSPDWCRHITLWNAKSPSSSIISICFTLFKLLLTEKGPQLPELSYNHFSLYNSLIFFITSSGYYPKLRSIATVAWFVHPYLRVHNSFLGHSVHKWRQWELSWEIKKAVTDKLFLAQFQQFGSVLVTVKWNNVKHIWKVHFKKLVVFHKVQRWHFLREVGNFVIFWCHSSAGVHTTTTTTTTTV